MRSFNSVTQRGFTLIEMSIVLIIIGLIIGGILKGQELIESARQKNFISQTDQIKAGINTFVDRFKGLPGDSGRGVNICALCDAGDDSGFVGTDVANYAGIIGLDANIAAAGATGENTEFFNHLVGANMIGGAVPVDTDTIAPAGFSGATATLSPFPPSSFPQSGLYVTYGNHQGTGASGALRTHWLRAQRFGDGTFAATDGIMSPQRILQLDLKYDDGLPDTGRIRGLGTADCQTAGAAGGAYDAAETSNICGVLVQAAD